MLAVAMCAVPLLRNLCSSVLTDKIPGSGLKTLRLVSKHMTAAMLDVVQGYTLRLDGRQIDLEREMVLLKDAKLSVLRVVLTHGLTSIGGLDGYSAPLHLLRCFITRMGAAISGIYRLEIESAHKDISDVDGVAELLSNLAPACTALRQLRVTGGFGREMFAAFGAHCNNLSHIELLHGGSYKAVQQLHILLPRLTHCSIAYTPAPACKRSTLALLSCATLTHIDLGSRPLTLEIWRLLPQGLRELQCSCLENAQFLEPVILPQLQRITCHCSSTDSNLPASRLAAILRWAPTLQTLFLSIKGGPPSGRPSHRGTGFCNMARLSVPCSSTCVADLVYVHERLTAGLLLTSAVVGEEVSQGISLSLINEESDYQFYHQEYDIPEFMATLPPLPHFIGLAVWCGYDHSVLSAIAQGIPAAFPNLTSLALELSSNINQENLIELSTLAAIRHLSIESPEVTTVSLFTLCQYMPELKTLCVAQCLDFDGQNGKVLQKLLQEQGFSIKITVRPSKYDMTTLDLDPDLSWQFS